MIKGGTPQAEDVVPPEVVIVKMMLDISDFNIDDYDNVGDN